MRFTAPCLKLSQCAFRAVLSLLPRVLSWATSILASVPPSLLHTEPSPMPHTRSQEVEHNPQPDTEVLKAALQKRNRAARQRRSTRKPEGQARRGRGTQMLGGRLAAAEEERKVENEEEEEEDRAPALLPIEGAREGGGAKGGEEEGEQGKGRVRKKRGRRGRGARDAAGAQAEGGESRQAGIGSRGGGQGRAGSRRGQQEGFAHHEGMLGRRKRSAKSGGGMTGDGPDQGLSPWEDIEDQSGRAPERRKGTARRGPGQTQGRGRGRRYPASTQLSSSDREQNHTSHIPLASFSRLPPPPLSPSPFSNLDTSHLPLNADDTMGLSRIDIPPRSPSAHDRSNNNNHTPYPEQRTHEVLHSLPPAEDASLMIDFSLPPPSRSQFPPSFPPPPAPPNIPSDAPSRPTNLSQHPPIPSLPLPYASSAPVGPPFTNFTVGQSQDNSPSPSLSTPFPQPSSTRAHPAAANPTCPSPALPSIQPSASTRHPPAAAPSPSQPFVTSRDQLKAHTSSSPASDAAPLQPCTPSTHDPILSASKPSPLRSPSIRSQPHTGTGKTGKGKKRIRSELVAPLEAGGQTRNPFGQQEMPGPFGIEGQMGNSVRQRGKVGLSGTERQPVGLIGARASGGGGEGMSEKGVAGKGGKDGRWERHEGVVERREEKTDGQTNFLGGQKGREGLGGMERQGRSPAVPGVKQGARGRREGVGEQEGQRSRRGGEAERRDGVVERREGRREDERVGQRSGWGCMIENGEESPVERQFIPDSSEEESEWEREEIESEEESEREGGGDSRGLYAELPATDVSGTANEGKKVARKGLRGP